MIAVFGKPSVIVLVLLFPLFGSVPLGASQSPDAPPDQNWGIEDDTGDVAVLNEDAEEASPAVPASAIPQAGLLDIVSASVSKEGGLEIYFDLVLANPSYTSASGSATTISYGLCFLADEKSLVARTSFTFPADGSGPALSSRGYIFASPDGCSSFALPSNPLAMEVQFKAEEKTLTFAVPKYAIANVTGRMVHEGDQLTGIQFFSQQVVGPPIAGAYAVDRAPNDGPAANPYALMTPMHNQHVRLSVGASAGGASETNLRCEGSIRPVVGVEANKFQAIPIALQNDAESPTRVKMWVETPGADWEVRIIPELTIPSVIDARGGQSNATLIVKSPPSEARTCTPVRVFAQDVDDPGRAGQVAIDVLATPYLSPEQPTLYGHVSLYGIWMNAARDDPLSSPESGVPMRPYQQVQVCSSSKVDRRASVETAYPFDIFLDVSKPSKGHFHFRSDYAPTNARLTAELTAGGEIFAAGFRDVVIPTAPTTLDIDLLVEPDAWKHPLRRVPAFTQINFTLTYEPLRPVANVPTPGGEGAGCVYWYPGKSAMELPIDSVIRTQNQVLEEGYLPRLDLMQGTGFRYSGLGRQVVYNFTLTNEGVGVDGFRVSVASVETPPGAGWEISLSDDEFDELSPGEQETFQVRVLAPAAAPEASKVLIEVTATSLAAPTALASSVLTVQIAKDCVSGCGEVADDGEDDNGEGSGIPSVGPVLVMLAAVAAALMGWRRRT